MCYLKYFDHLAVHVMFRKYSGFKLIKLDINFITVSTALRSTIHLNVK
jgi:hypothetical protein